MKQLAIVLLVLTLIAALIFVALTNQRILETIQGGQPTKAPTQTAAPEPTRLLPVTSPNQVVVECQLLPEQSAQLSFSTGGVVEEVLVEEGQVVMAGQALARLGGGKAADASVATAQRELSDAGAALKALNEDAFLATAQALKDLRDAEVAEKDARKALRDLQDNKESDEKIAQAEANLGLARARTQMASRIYEVLKNGPDPEKITAADLRLKDAQAQLAAAQESLAALELLAPFGGTVIQVDLAPGEFTSPGAPAILLANTSSYYVETTDLSEMNVLRVQPGSPAIVTFDALQNEPVQAAVSSLQPIGKNVQGEVIYKAVIDGDFSGKGLLWGMTCSAVIGKK